MTNLILNIIGAIFGGVGALIGITQKDTWNNKQPTKIGWIAIVFLTMALGTQITIQIFDFQAKKSLEEDNKRLNAVIEQKYNGWVSIGTFLKNEGWTCDRQEIEDNQCPYLTGTGISKKTNPESIKTNDSQVYLVATRLTAYKDPLPDIKCLPQGLNRENSIPFERNQSVKIIDKKVYSDCPNQGQTRVLLKVIINTFESK